jgi:hypothetical protein
LHPNFCGDEINISKNMAKRMKRRESLELKPKGNQIALEIDHE